MLAIYNPIMDQGFLLSKVQDLRIIPRMYPQLAKKFLDEPSIDHSYAKDENHARVLERRYWTWWESMENLWAELRGLNYAIGSLLGIEEDSVIHGKANISKLKVNSADTRNIILGVANATFTNLEKRRDIYQSKVICDETNNSPDVVENNMLVVTVEYMAGLTPAIHMIHFVFGHAETAKAVLDLQEFPYNQLNALDGKAGDEVEETS